MNQNNLPPNPEPVVSVSPDSHIQPVKKNGCGLPILYIILFFWVTFISLVSNLVIWILEQGNFSGEIVMPDLRWAAMLAGSLLIMTPCLVFVIFLKPTYWRFSIRAWAQAGFFALLMVPSFLTFVSDFQTTMIIKMLTMGIYLVILLAWVFLAKIPKRPTSWSGTWLACLCGGLLVLPWLFGGSLGSITDTLLALVVSLMFGISASLTLEWIVVPEVEPNPNSHPNWIWLQALTAVGVIGIMSSAIAQSGNQFELLLTVPLIGLAAAALSIYKTSRQSSSQWIPLSILIGLALLWPLALVDPDELMFIITSSAGDLMPLIFRLSIEAFFLVLFLGLLLLTFQKKLRLSSEKPRLRWLGVLGVWVVMVGVYFFLGRPGFYGEQLFVILKDQADVSSALQIKDYNQRRAFVYKSLVNQADSTQKPIQDTLRTWGISYKSYYLVNALEVDGGPLVKLWLSTRPEVDRVLASPHLRPLPENLPVSSGDLVLSDGSSWNLKMIRADQVQKELKITGKGVIVGQSDSGVQGDHPELVSTYRGVSAGDDFNWFDPWYHTQKPTDLGGHGTHTLGSILGQNVGVAPGAQWIGCANLARNLGNPAFYLDCMQFMLAPFPQDGNPLKDGDPTRGAMVLNDSWGCPDVEGCDANTLVPAVKALRYAGVFVVASAGNGGMAGCNTVEDPLAIYQEVFSVGAVDKNGQLAEFSSKGPVTVDGSGRVKPDIIAPGMDVFSSMPKNSYAINSGTSMAGPHAVGVVALMWSANPKLIGDIDLTTQILNSTAQPFTGIFPTCAGNQSTPNNAVGYGIIDAYAAVKAALEVK